MTEKDFTDSQAAEPDPVAGRERRKSSPQWGTPEMKYVKYTSVGLSLSGKAGKVSYLHTDCHNAMNATTAGPKGEEIEGNPQPDIKCIWCGKPIEVTSLA